MRVPSACFGVWKEVRGRSRKLFKGFSAEKILPAAWREPELDPRAVECQLEYNSVRRRTKDEICFLDAPMVVARSTGRQEDALELALALTSTTWGGLACLSEESTGLTRDSRFREAILGWALTNFESLNRTEEAIRCRTITGLWNIPSTLKISLAASGVTREQLVEARSGREVLALLKEFTPAR